MTFEHHRYLFWHLGDRKRCFPVCQKLFRSPRNQSRHLLFQVCFRKLRLISKTKPQYVLATASSPKIVFPRLGSNRGLLGQKLSGKICWPPFLSLKKTSIPRCARNGKLFFFEKEIVGRKFFHARQNISTLQEYIFLRMRFARYWTH